MLRLFYQYPRRVWAMEVIAWYIESLLHGKSLLHDVYMCIICYESTCVHMSMADDGTKCSTCWGSSDFAGSWDSKGRSTTGILFRSFPMDTPFGLQMLWTICPMMHHGAFELLSLTSGISALELPIRVGLIWKIKQFENADSRASFCACLGLARIV